MRQVVLAVESWLQAGNLPELDGILDRADAAEWACASPLSLGGYLHPPVEDSQAIDDMALLIHSLPAPRVRKAVDDLASRPATRVVPTELELVEAPIPFAQPHLEAMLATLKEHRTPQSASRYWEGNADREYGVRTLKFSYKHTSIKCLQISREPRGCLEGRHSFQSQLLLPWRS